MNDSGMTNPAEEGVSQAAEIAPNAFFISRKGKIFYLNTTAATILSIDPVDALHKDLDLLLEFTEISNEPSDDGITRGEDVTTLRSDTSVTCFARIRSNQQMILCRKLRIASGKPENEDFLYEIQECRCDLDLSPEDNLRRNLQDQSIEFLAQRVIELEKEITAHIAANAILSNKEQKVSSILEMGPIGTLLLEKSTREVLLINKTAQEIFASFLIQPKYDVIEDLLLRPLADHPAAENMIAKYEISIEHGILGYSVYPIETNYLCLYLRDITELKHLEAISQSMFIMQNINMIFSSIRHELGNPLSILKTSLTMLGDGSQQIPPSAAQVYIQRCIRACNSIEDLLNQLRSYHYFENLPKESVDIIPLLENTIEQYQGFATRPSEQLRMETALTACWVCGSKRGLYQVFSNLLKNAVESAGAGRDLMICVKVEKARKSTLVEIQDNGVGIDPYIIPRIFIPLFTTKKNGNGLGLAIAKKILLQFNASLVITSELNVGTKASVKLESSDPPMS